MRAVQFDMKDPAFPASIVELPEPDLPDRTWARVAVLAGGICGSDLHLFTQTTGPSPTLASMGSIPFVLGHEIGGRIIEVGSDCPHRIGTRVAVDPCIPCRSRGIDPPCANCARGWSSSCLNLDTGVVSTGRTLGFTRGLGGGWSEQVLAHHSMLHPLPDQVTDRASSLCEPLSISCHGLLRAMPRPGEPVLIVGAGIIGLAALAALRGLVPECPVTVLARHEHQAVAATTCGADHVVLADASNRHFEVLGDLVGARLVGYKRHVMFMGGFPFVVEAVGTARSVTEALRMTAHRGTVLMLGTAGTNEVDLTPIWYKEIALVGSIDHAIDATGAPGLAGGPGRHSLDRAIDILAAGLLPDEVVVTHEFALDDYQEAVRTAIDRRNTNAIKVVFHPSGAQLDP